MYKQLNILKISDIYHLELGKFMYQLYSDIGMLWKMYAVFAQLFKKIKEIHSHSTRRTKSTFLPCVSKTIGQQFLTFRGVQLW